MDIKTVCKLSLKIEKEFQSYTDYEIYPLAAVFADSNADALVSYITKMTSEHIEIQECEIMEVTLAHGDILRFYRVKGRNTKLGHNIVADYIVIDVPFIGS